METTRLERTSQALEPGKLVAMGADTWTDLLSDTDTDKGVKFLIQNPSSNAASVTVRLATAASSSSKGLGEGIVLAPGAVWEEDRYAGPVCARCSAAVSMSVVIL